MSVSRTYTVFCDGCGRVAPGPMGGHMDIQQARRDARRAGWRRVKRGPDAPNYGRGADYCPSCASIRKLS